jgi:hypothetical protein
LSRFTVTILLACVLLGMLLWIVLSTVAQLANPQPLVVLEEELQAVEFDPQLPVIQNGSELIDWLSEHRMANSDAITSINNYRYWLENRGYPTQAMWVGVNVPELVNQPAFLDRDNDADLLSLAGAGSAEAAELLGESSLRENPVAALEWFDQAIVNGSIFAMVRTADLLTSLSDPALAGFKSGAVWQQALEEINSQQPVPRERALAWNIAVVIVGGFAVLDGTHANRIAELSAQLDRSGINRACESAQDYVLGTAMARRARGGAVFSTERPLFAVSVADPEQVLPCEIPVLPLVDMSNCITENFVGPGQRLWQMFFCPSP